MSECKNDSCLFRSSFISRLEWIVFYVCVFSVSVEVIPATTPLDLSFRICIYVIVCFYIYFKRSISVPHGARVEVTLTQ